VPAVRIGALDACDAFRIVTAIQNIPNGLLDTNDAVAAVRLGIPLLIAFLEGRKICLENALDEVVAPRNIE